MPLKVLIVDDEPFARADLRYMLAKHPDIEFIWEAGKVDEARELLTRYSPDVVFLDAQLRGGTGFDLLADIQSTSANIIFVTAHRNYEKEALESGAVDFIHKPVAPDRLADSLKKIVKPTSKKDDHSVISCASERKVVPESPSEG